jgi:hypothetical protein
MLKNKLWLLWTFKRQRASFVFECGNERTNERRNERKNERTNERTKERTNERTNERKEKKRKNGFSAVFATKLNGKEYDLSFPLRRNNNISLRKLLDN